ncbi:MAG: hypothetical protein QOE25_1305 [Actinomycetota bacterium]|nr:hypothetical protein [Actinomycetota bacterium]
MRRTRRRARWIAAVGVALSALAACGTSVGPAGPDSGIVGTITVGPQCPVVQAESPCPDTPFDGKVQISLLGKGVIAEETVDATGSYRVPLDPGTYTIEPVPVGAGGFPAAAPKTVVVRTGAFTRVDITVDSGIR